MGVVATVWFTLGSFLPGFGFSRLSLGWFDCLQLVGWLFVWWVACLRVGLRIWAVVCGVGWCGLGT